MKGLLFGGCSFTWGQGLYYYSDYQQKKEYNINYGFDSNGLTQSMLQYKNQIRYPNLVASHFKTFYVFKKDVGQLLGNGGSEDETFDYFDYIFNVEKNYNFNDFEYLIIQTSSIFRNDFIFNLNEIEYKRKLHNLNLKTNTLVRGKEFDKYCEINNFSYDDIENLHIKQQFNRLKNRVNYYVERGLKVLILCWTPDYEKCILSDSFLEQRLIRLECENKIYTDLSNMMDNHKNMTIVDDFKNNHNIIIEDSHPSKYCHRIIANSVIKKIEDEIHTSP